MSVSRLWGGWAMAACVLLPANANATPIPIEITADISGHNYTFNMFGPGFEYFVNTSEGPYIVGLCASIPCDTGNTYSAGEPGVRFGERMELNGRTASEAGGWISILFPLLEGALADQEFFSATAPITLRGEITAYAAGTGSVDRGEPLFAVIVNGSGQARSAAARPRAPKRWSRAPISRSPARRSRSRPRLCPWRSASVLLRCWVLDAGCV